MKKHSLAHGFTIVELIITVVVIAALTIIAILSYIGMTVKAIDSSIFSDVSNMDKKQKVYLVSNDNAKEYYSGLDAEYNQDLDYRPSRGNVIDVVISGSDYCIRGYNTSGTYNNIDTAYTKGSTLDACSTPPMDEPSDDANDDSPGDDGGGDGGGGGWKQLSASYSHTCGIYYDDKVYCWGENDYGQLGNNSTDDYKFPTAVDTTGVLSGKTIKLVSTGGAHTCVIASDNQAYCWGRNWDGQLGNNSDVNSPVPVAVDTSGVLSGKTVKFIASGGSDSNCIIASDDKAYCWGYNDGDGELGNNTTDSSYVPVAVDTSGVLNGKTIKAISSGAYHTCVVASDDKAYCWGYNGSGELGNNTTDSSLVPVAVDTTGALLGKAIESISAGGSDHTCAIASDNQAYCWGYNGDGELGINTYDDSYVPVAVDTTGVLNGKTIKSIVAGDYSNCVIASDDKAYCWGYNYRGQLGNNSTTNSPVAVAVDDSGLLSGKTIRSMTVGEYHSCAIAYDGSAYCWGYNSSGQLGNNSITDSHVAVAVLNPGYWQSMTMKSISGGIYHTCAIASNSHAYCWGDNYQGQLGDNSTSKRKAPVAVDTSGVLNGLTIESISAFGGHVCAIASDGKAYCWGYNYYGELGNNSTTDSHVPVAVDFTGVLSGKTLKSITTGENTTCAVASDNDAYCWGSAYLGDGTTNSSSVPVAVDTSGTLSGLSIKSISRGNLHTCVIASDNNAYCWGNNSNGQLGDGTNNDSSVPVAVNTDGVLSGKTIKSISAGQVHTCVVASDNNAYCWGRNGVGGLGNNSTTDSNVPVAVNTDGVLSGKTIKLISVGAWHTCAIASDDQAYCWGANANGELGNNSTISSSVPVAVDTSGALVDLTIKYITGGGLYNCAIASNNLAYCWGYGSLGTLGIDRYSDMYAPIAVYTHGILGQYVPYPF